MERFYYTLSNMWGISLNLRQNGSDGHRKKLQHHFNASLVTAKSFCFNCAFKSAGAKTSKQTLSICNINSWRDDSAWCSKNTPSSVQNNSTLSLWIRVSRNQKYFNLINSLSTSLDTPHSKTNCMSEVIRTLNVEKWFKMPFVFAILDSCP